MEQTHIMWYVNIFWLLTCGNFIFIVACEMDLGIIQKLGNETFLIINILQAPDTHAYLYVSRGYGMLMFKSFALGNFTK